MGRFYRKTRKRHTVRRKAASRVSNLTPNTCVVILGFAHRDSDALSSRLMTGVNEFFRLSSSSSSPWLLVTGGDTVGLGVTEAHDLASRAIALGVPASRILVEDQARNTIENAFFTYRILNPMTTVSTIVVVTNEFHMARSLSVFQDVAKKLYEDKGANRFTIVPLPAPNGDPSLLLSQTGSSLSQWVAHENKQLSTSVRNICQWNTSQRKKRRYKKPGLLSVVIDK